LEGETLVRWAGAGGNGKEHMFSGWRFSGISFGIDAGIYIRGVVKSPQLGLILAKRAYFDLT
jgi:hypothetical protein